ncbi:MULTISPECIES: hypothetical protein [Clostridium]|jgi:hypothetical protein|nr:hypothetical protein [Clostridium saudiense]
MKGNKSDDVVLSVSALDRFSDEIMSKYIYSSKRITKENNKKEEAAK